ncbi:MAG: long-chain acyl-CoA synthetase [Actinomycetota bacterium]|nr:long-chain acyl-CoA synthetase [Actinomycetota bacterium]
MDEYTAPALVEPGASGNLTDAVVENAREAPDDVLFSRRDADNHWQDVTARQFLTDVEALAKGLVASGIQAGDRVALMSRTRYEWTLSDYAIWFAGAVTVPIYETSSAEQVRWILEDSEAVAVIVETSQHEATVTEVRDSLPALTAVWSIDEDGTIPLDTLATVGEKVTDVEVEARRAGVKPQDVATLIYTSGTTGRPKGCELTHGNFTDLTANATEILRSVVGATEASTLLFLPLAHVFARFIQVLCMASRTRMGHTADVKNLLGDLAEFQPTFILAVPRVFEKVYNSSVQRAEADGKGKIFHQAVDVAISYSEAQDHGSPGFGLRAKHAMFDKLVYGKLRHALGGKVTYAVSGGAPLGTRLGHFFRGIGVTVLEGYGLTETTAPTSVNTPERIKIGTVGRPLPGVGVRIGPDGEVLVKGVNVLKGYFNNSDATAEAITDGWFHSGDLGELDADGFLRITGRKKELIVTAGGKNVAPAVLEDRLRAHRLVSQCMVVGDAQPYIACLVTLDEEALPSWLQQQGKPEMSVAEAAEDDDVRAEVQRAIDDANKAVSKAEAIKRFKILTIDFTEENGALTPSLKLKRNVVMKEYAGEVDALYS